MTDQTIAPESNPKPARSHWDSALAPVTRGAGMLLLAGAFVPLLPGTTQLALLYFGISTFILGIVLGAVSMMLYFRECIGTEAFGDQKVIFFDRVERLAMPTWLQVTLVLIAVAAGNLGDSMTGVPSTVAAWVVVAVFAFAGARTIALSIRIWHGR